MLDRSAAMIEHLQQLWPRLRSLEEQAYVEFARFFYGRFYRFFLTKNLPPFEAEDEAATLVTDVLMRLDKFKPQEGIGIESWVYELMRHAAVDYHRRKKAPVVTIDVLPDRPVVVHSVNPRRVEAVREALDRLDGDARAIVELRDLGEERSYGEIAALLGISPGAARVRHHRALARLAEILAADSRIQLRAAASEPAVEPEKDCL